MAAHHKLAVILENPQNDAEFLLVKQTRPPKFDCDEYDSYVDSDLWDLPSSQLNLVEGLSKPSIAVAGAEPWSGKIDLAKFDFESALNQVLEQVGSKAADGGDWRLSKYVEEAQFGPGPPINSVFIRGKLVASEQNLQESCKWMSVPSCLSWLLEVKPSSDRVGPLIVAGLLNESEKSREMNIPSTLPYQEYPPGVVLVPMGSRTGKPFYTTNLIVFAPKNASNEFVEDDFIACGDALIVDPGCRSEFHEELAQIVTSLPRKLVVFVTHHHRDHVDGLSVIQRCNPDATLLAHENTMRRIGKDDWSLGFTAISGTEEICIGGQRLIAVFSPGHTDGHMALLHASTHSLIVGDHCVGQGSAVLDVTGGGNMTMYSDRGVLPFRNRRARESSVLKAIENGAETLFDIVSTVYSEIDRSIWIHCASNVRLHVDHLAQQDKLPKGFSLETFHSSLAAFFTKVGNYEPNSHGAYQSLLHYFIQEFSIQRFQKTCRLHFFSRWIGAYLSSGVRLNCWKPWKPQVLIARAVASFAVLYLFKNRFVPNKTCFRM
ncbi:hypothetical protein DVH24_040436 [Malus domestica]|uniref:Metallo-beta-lactamase domain-containing protein n=1 Tax=Malus domestica TaxID=3750 RepID=A0A498I8P0_MALDO|nr:hypothetical protein DVH24_040436 [Malus domestica]